MDTNPSAPETVSEPTPVKNSSPATPVATNNENKPQVNIDMLLDVPLTVTIELGRTSMTLKQALEIQQGSVVELNRLAVVRPVEVVRATLSISMSMND